MKKKKLELEDLKDLDVVKIFLHMEKERVKIRQEMEILKQSEDVKRYLELVNRDEQFQRGAKSLVLNIPLKEFASPYGKNRKVESFCLDKDRAKVKILTLGGTIDDVRECMEMRITYYWKWNKKGV